MAQAGKNAKINQFSSIHSLNQPYLPKRRTTFEFSLNSDPILAQLGQFAQLGKSAQFAQLVKFFQATDGIFTVCSNILVHNN